MNNTLRNVLIFSAGAAIGAVSTWFGLKQYYQKVVEAEIESVKEEFGRNFGPKEVIRPSSSGGDTDGDHGTVDPADKIPKDTNSINMDMLKKYQGEVKKLDYTQYANAHDAYEQKYEDPEYLKEPEEDLTHSDKPYVIPPQEFGELDGYEVFSLYFYRDHIVADDNDDILDNLDVIGADSLNHFGEYEDDCVYVRNDRLKCDYEILLSMKTYEEVLKEKPYKRAGNEV